MFSGKKLPEEDTSNEWIKKKNERTEKEEEEEGEKEQRRERERDRHTNCVMSILWMM